MRISADEQLRLVQALHERRLGLSKRCCSLVEHLMFRGQTQRHRLFALDSINRVVHSVDAAAVSWFVGWVELPQNTVYFAANSLPKAHAGASAERLSQTVLSDLRVTVSVA